VVEFELSQHHLSTTFLLIVTCNLISYSLKQLQYEERLTLRYSLCDLTKVAEYWEVTAPPGSTHGRTDIVDIVDCEVFISFWKGTAFLILIKRKRQEVMSRIVSCMAASHWLFRCL